MSRSNPENPVIAFDKPKHVKYWLRCLKTFLPTNYTSNDTQRMTLAFFTLSALDLLDALFDHTSEEERRGYADWIYRCQHVDGGFKGFTGGDSGAALHAEGACWDPANLAATFFALVALMVLGDNMERVKKAECLAWVRRLQREDGSFGEAIGRSGIIDGGEDIRYCYLAASVRSILRRGERKGSEDFDVENLVRYVEKSVTYEGGIAKAPLHEAHAGCTYCGVGVLRLLDRLPSTNIQEPNSSAEGFFNKTVNVQYLLRWLVNRQTLYIEEDEECSDLEGNCQPPSFQKEHSQSYASLKAQEPSIEPSLQELQCAGFNGRVDKVADTCYAFWVGGSLAMLQKVHLQDFNATRRYLLQRTQHMIGGFGKLCGDVPDILHSYLGLAALATMRDPELRSIDPTLCISIRAKEEFEAREIAAEVNGDPSEG